MSVKIWHPYGQFNLPPNRKVIDFSKNYSGNAPKVSIPKIDLSKDNIIIWVPGTNDHRIPEKFSSYISQHFKGSHDLVLCDYIASWDLTVSSFNGRETLKATLDYISKKKKPGTKIYLAGLSQGSMVIGEVLKDPKYYNLVSKVCLIGHPGISSAHYADVKVKEINNPLDPTTFYWSGNHEKILKGISGLVNYNISSLPYFIWLILKNPIPAAWLGVVSLRNIPLHNFSTVIPNVHNYEDSMDEAASWLFRQ